jgi:hypothetical protein
VIRRTFVRALACLALAALGAVTTTGCFHSVTAICDSSGNVPIDPDGYEVIHHPVEGTSDFFTLFGIPLSSGNQVKKARDAALLSARADALVNVSMRLDYTSWFGIVHKFSTVVTADGVARVGTHATTKK